MKQAHEITFIFGDLIVPILFDSKDTADSALHDIRKSLSEENKSLMKYTYQVRTVYSKSDVQDALLMSMFLQAKNHNGQKSHP